MKLLRQALLLAVLLTVLASAAQAPRSSAVLRVGLWTLWHDREIVLGSVPGQVAAVRHCLTCAAVPLKDPVTVRATGNQLTLAGQPLAWLATSGALLVAAHGEKLALPYPLTLAAHDGQLTLTVTLPLESYVERVVASESGPADSLESLKALAVVVRSFALHQPHGHAAYELCDSTHCQLLRWGQSSPRQAAAHVATLATASETLWYRGRRAAAWFHQDCGGRTAAPAEIWPDRTHTPLPWLAAHADSYCTASGGRQWSAELTLAELRSALAAQGLARPGWSTLTVVSRGESGRISALRAGSDEFTGEQFRLAVGRTFGFGHILSDWFEIARQGDRFLFRGRGSGHGVGLCQAGSAAMAASGRSYREILAQYFPGATAADEDTGKSWQSFAAQDLRLESLDPVDALFLPRLKEALVEAEGRTGLPPTGPIVVRAFASTEGFRRATLAPGWVAAFTEGNWVALQALRTLDSRKILAETLRHELTHALVEGVCGPATPLWLREGLAEVWAGGGKPRTTAKPAMKPDEVSRALAHSTSEAQSQAAHRAAAFYVARLLERFGRAQVLEWLRTGIPANALATLSM